jgi:hypothetical protein
MAGWMARGEAVGSGLRAEWAFFAKRFDFRDLWYIFDSLEDRLLVSQTGEAMYGTNTHNWSMLTAACDPRLGQGCTAGVVRAFVKGIRHGGEP